MKKLFTLILGLGVFAASFGQTREEEARRVILGEKKSDKGTNTGSKPDARDVILGGGTNDNKTGYPTTSRQAEIDQVNREYDAKIQSVRNNPALSAEEKDRMIRQLERDRARRIKQINERYDGRRDRDDDDDDRKDKVKKQKGNNGNHYGWEKGKGNPHRSDGGAAPGKTKEKSSKEKSSNGKSKGKKS